MIVVTGSSGFIGSQIALHLESSNEELLLVDRQNLAKDRPYVQRIKKAQFIDATEFLLELPKLKKSVDWVIHMGAISNTAETDLLELQKWNVDYTKSIWQFCSDQKVNLIYASSAATYGNGEEGFSDHHSVVSRLKPLNPYGQSKNEFDSFALTSKACPPLWYGLKFFNVYGPNENHKGRMASAVWHGYNEIKKTGAMTLFKSHNPDFKDGDQARDFIYVGDVLKIIDFMKTKTPENGIYNLGTGEPGTFMQLAQALFKEMNKPFKINWVETPMEFRKAYQYRTQANISKLRTAGYGQSMTPLSDGIHNYLTALK